ncbi:MAG: Na+/H+ antiporter NhaA [Gammaproteobacteria bacterium]
MLCPALTYLIFNSGGPDSSAWGVPIATDTAFALGLLAMLGRTVPLSLRIFVAAAAIADDVGAILVIAVFYTDDLALVSTAVAVAFFGVALILNWMRVYRPLPYTVTGIALWMAVLYSGLHPTLAGVLLAFTIPTRSSPNTYTLLGQSQAIFHSMESPAIGERSESRYQSAVRALESMVERMLSPSQRLERDLQQWSAYLVLPLFALANVGITLSADALDVLQPVGLGIIAGLALGKPLGVTLGAWLAVRAGFAAKPDDFGWRQVVGAGFLCGIGFTMSFLIADVAFAGSDLLPLAKFSVMLASVISGTVGWMLLRGVREG